MKVGGGMVSFFTLLVFIMNSALAVRHKRHEIGESRFAALESIIRSNFDALTRNSLERKLPMARYNYESIENDLKDPIRAAIERGQVEDMLGVLVSAVMKLKESDSNTFISGITELVTGISLSMDGPSSYAFRMLNGLISSVFGLYDGRRLKSALRKVIDGTLKDISDEELKDHAEGLVDKYADYKSALDSYRENEGQLKEATVDGFLKSMDVERGNAFHRVLKSRIHPSASSETEARNIYSFIQLFTVLCLLKDSIYIDLYNTVLLSNHLPFIANAIAEYRRGTLESYADVLKFLRLQDNDEYNTSKFRILALFYPEEQSEGSKRVSEFMDLLNIARVPAWSFKSHHKYYLVPEYYPTHTMCNLRPKNAGGDKTTTSVGSCRQSAIDRNVEINRVGKGFFQIFLEGRQMKLKGDISGAEALSHDDFNDDDLKLFRLIPKTPEGGIFLITSKRYPNEFLYMGSNNEGNIYTYQGDPGKQGYWTFT